MIPQQINSRKSITRGLTKADNFTFSIRVGFWLTLMILSQQLIIDGTTANIVIGIVLFGLMSAHGVELQHQALHGTAFTSRVANRLVGFVLGLPMFVSYSAYRDAHLWHHRFLGSLKDREFFNFKRNAGVGRADLFKHVISLARFQKLAAEVKMSLSPHSKMPYRTRVEYIGMLVLVSSFFAFALVTSNPLLIVGWIVSLLVVAEPIHNLIELPEHFGCDSSTRVVLRNTRSITSNRFMTWYTNSNNLHVEHHLYPGVPMQMLGRIHSDLQPDLAYYNQTYFDFFRTIRRYRSEPASEVASSKMQAGEVS